MSEKVHGARDLCVVGAGQWGRNLVRNFHALGALRMVCDISQENRAAACASAPWIETCSDLTEVLGDPQIRGVVVASPAEHHFDMATRVLESDRDVFVEKPLALKLAEGKRLVALAGERGRTLMV